MNGTGPDVRMLRQAALRLGAQAALTVATIVALLGGVAVLVVLRSQQSDSETLLTTTIAREIDVVDPPAGVWLVVQTPAGRQSTPGMPDGLPDEAALRAVPAGGPGSFGDFHTGGVEYRILTDRRGNAVVQAALDTRTDDQERTRLLEAMAISGAVGLLLAAAAGAWLGRRAVAPLSAALALQRRFVSDASHELRTPLTLLSTRAQLIRRGLRAETDPELRSDMDGLVADAEHLTDSLEDLLLAADPRGGTERVDLAQLADQVAASCAPAAGDTGITISCDTEQVWVSGSAAGLRRALTAVVDNAIRHAQQTVRIEVRLRNSRDAVVEVHDDGAGIAPDMLPKLFERFASAPDPSDRRRRYGLGLALVSETAARHGGTVDARNDPNGAVLVLRLPASA
jgi:signal transduction histidine kinase